MKQHCCDPRRLEVLEAKGSANAIEFIEVLDLASPPGAPRQQTLLVRLLHSGFTLSPDNLRITGGERIATVGVVWCAPADALPAEAEPGLVDTVDDLAAHAGRPHRQQRRLFDLHVRHLRQFRLGPAAGRLRSEAVGDRLHLQGRMPLGL